MPDTLSITDNRTGQTIEIPVDDYGAFNASELKKLGILSFDQPLLATATAHSARSRPVARSLTSPGARTSPQSPVRQIAITTGSAASASRASTPPALMPRTASTRAGHTSGWPVAGPVVIAELLTSRPCSA